MHHEEANRRAGPKVQRSGVAHPLAFRFGVVPQRARVGEKARRGNPLRRTQAQDNITQRNLIKEK